MAGIESVPDQALKVDASEEAARPEFVELRNNSQVRFFKNFLSAKYPNTPFEDLKSEQYPEEMVGMLTAGLQNWFQEWWTRQEHLGAVTLEESSDAVGDRAYEEFKARRH